MRFWKYHGNGNDFILFDDPGGTAPKDGALVKRLCDRRTGIGADGVLYVGRSSGADATMRIINSDGSEAEMCGNGIRCVAKHLYDRSIVRRTEMIISTLAGLRSVRCSVSGGEVKDVTVDMGAPSLECADVPMKCDGSSIDVEISVEGRRIRGTGVSMGNPHFVVLEDLDGNDIKTLGPAIEGHPAFPERTNVEFVKADREGLDVTVFERGAGWTLACGTGACASAVAAALQKLIPFDREVKVRLPGGSMWVKVSNDMSTVTMRGPAVRVHEGDLDLG